MRTSPISSQANTHTHVHFAHANTLKRTNLRWQRNKRKKSNGDTYYAFRRTRYLWLGMSNVCKWCMGSLAKRRTRHHIALMATLNVNILWNCVAACGSMNVAQPYHISPHCVIFTMNFQITNHLRSSIAIRVTVNFVTHRWNIFHKSCRGFIFEAACGVNECISHAIECPWTQSSSSRRWFWINDTMM